MVPIQHTDKEELNDHWIDRMDDGKFPDLQPQSFSPDSVSFPASQITTFGSMRRDFFLSLFLGFFSFFDSTAQCDSLLY